MAPADGEADRAALTAQASLGEGSEHTQSAPLRGASRGGLVRYHGAPGFLLPETIAQPPTAPFDVIPSAARNLRRCAVVMRRFQPQGSSWGMRAFRFLTPLRSVRNDSWRVFSQDGAQSYAKVSFRRNGMAFQPTLALPTHVENASLGFYLRRRALELYHVGADDVCQGVYLR